MNENMEINDVSIEIGSRMYGSFKGIQNTPSHVLAEFVDNALQSYRDNAKRLHELEPDYKLVVSIDAEWDESSDRAKTVTIKDNAGGIASNRYINAFMPAKIPENNQGLNEKGMGMKTAACWLGNTWLVKTAALGEIYERVLSFDLDTVVEQELTKVPVKQNLKNINDHYTEIFISNPTDNFPTIRKISEIKEELASIYRRSLRSNEMILKVCGEELSFEDYEVLEAPFVKTPDAAPIFWKKDVEIKFKDFRAKGFIGLLRRMNSTQNGIVVFRRGRAILGANINEKRYTPKSLCGSLGSPRYKRLFGEIEIEGFDVSFNKNDILDRDSLDLLMDLIKEEVHTKEFDLITQGDDFREDQTRKAINSIVTKHNNSSKGPKSPVKITTPVVRETPAIIPSFSPQTPVESAPKPVLLGQYEDSYTINGTDYVFKSLFVDQGDLFWVDLSQKKDKVIICRINTKHVFFETFKLSEPIIVFLRSLAIAKFMAMEDGQGKASELCNNFNEVIKVIKR